MGRTELNSPFLVQEITREVISPRMQTSLLVEPSTFPINDDLINEILDRLPTKSLRRFQCASKTWSKMISHVFSQRIILGPMTGLFFYPNCSCPEPEDGIYAFVLDGQSCQEDGEAFVSCLTGLPFLSTSRVVHSCHGLLLFASKKTRYYCTVSYHVCNPVTKEFLLLPKTPDSSGCGSSTSYLAFDPRVSPHYKVIHFVMDHLFRDHDNRRTSVVEIYCSRTGRWDEFQMEIEGHVDLRIGESVYNYYQDVLWMLSPNGLTFRVDRLVRFDIEKRSLKLLLLPDELHGQFHIKERLGESRGHLYYVACYRSELKIWKCEEEKEGAKVKQWLLMHSISAKVLYRNPLTYDASRLRQCGLRHPIWLPFESTEIIFEPLAFHPDSEVIYLGFDKRIFSYHPSNGNLEEVYSSNKWMMNRQTFIIAPCFESLDPPGGKLINYRFDGACVILDRKTPIVEPLLEPERFLHLHKRIIGQTSNAMATI